MIYLEAQENLKGKSMKRRLHKNSPYKEKLLLSEGTILFSTFDGRYYGSLDKEIGTFWYLSLSSFDIDGRGISLSGIP